MIMGAASISETLVNFRLHGATSRRTEIFIITPVRTSNLTKIQSVEMKFLISVKECRVCG
jgi:hypothetical protein